MSESIVISPIIVIGMHRSGTSIVTNILEDIGVRMGCIKDTNFEPRAYIALNNWILTQAGTSWQYPLSIHRMLDNAECFENVCEIIRNASNSPMIKIVHPSRIYSTHKPWGWKDPRNSVTLKIWLSVYPQAKIIYVKRHGVPVAASLCTRRRKFSKGSYRWWHKVLTPIKPGPALGTRSWELDSSFEMWCEYNKIIVDQLALIDNPVQTLEYENLINSPEETIAGIAQFVGIPADSGKVSRIAQKVSKNNPYSFREKSELLALEKKYHQELKSVGY